MKLRIKEIYTFTLPILIENAFIVLMGTISMVMVAGLGEEALSAVGHINHAIHLSIGLFAAMATGGTIIVAQAIGAGDRAKAARAGGQSLTLTVGFSVLLMLLLWILQRPVIAFLFSDSDPLMVATGHIYFTYMNATLPLLAVSQVLFGVMRGGGDAKTPMLISLAMNGTHLIASFVLIRGVSVNLPFLLLETPTFGMHGAGMAVGLSRLVGMVYALWVVISAKSVIRLHRPSYYIPTWDMQKKILALGIPAGMESSLFQVGKVLTQMFIIGMGTAAMAANATMSSVIGLVMVPGNALLISVMVLVGQRAGRRELDDIPKTTLTAVAVASLAMLALTLLMVPLRETFADFYNLYGDSRIYFGQLFYIGLIAHPLLWTLAFIIPSGLRAVKDVTFTMFVAVGSMWVCRIVLGYVLGVMLGWGVLGVWVGMFADWGGRALLYFVRLMRKRWIKKLQREAEAKA